MCYSCLGGTAIHSWRRTDCRASVRLRQSSGRQAAGTGLLVLPLPVHHYACAADDSHIRPAGIRHSRDHVPPCRKAERCGTAAGSGSLTTPLHTHLGLKKSLWRNNFFSQFWEGWYRYIRKLKSRFYMRRKTTCRHQKDIFRRGNAISLSPRNCGKM